MRRRSWAWSGCGLLIACAAADPGVENLTRGEFADTGAPSTNDAAQAADSSDGAAPDSGATDSAEDSSGDATDE